MVLWHRYPCAILRNIPYVDYNASPLINMSSVVQDADVVQGDFNSFARKSFKFFDGQKVDRSCWNIIAQSGPHCLANGIKPVVILEIWKLHNFSAPRIFDNWSSAEVFTRNSTRCE